MPIKVDNKRIEQTFNETAKMFKKYDPVFVYTKINSAEKIELHPIHLKKTLKNSNLTPCTSGTIIFCPE